MEVTIKGIYATSYSKECLRATYSKLVRSYFSRLKREVGEAGGGCLQIGEVKWMEPPRPTGTSRFGREKWLRG